MFAFGGIDLAPYISVTNVTRSVAPKRRLTRTEVPGMDGELVRADGLEAMEVTVAGHLAARSIEGTSALRRLLAKTLACGEPRPLVLPDEPTVYLLALYQGGAELSRHSKRAKVELGFLCPDPVAYGAARAQTISGTSFVEAGGTYPARPVVTAKPPKGSYWQITSVDTGDFVRVDSSFTGSQTLVVDMGLQRCTVNGSDVPCTVSSDFFAIEGSRQIKVSGGTAELEWNERWL